MDLDLLRFVQINFSNRDKSHGYAHSERVCNLSNLILLEEIKTLNLTKYGEGKLFHLIQIVAWLHDIFDHKYCKDQTMRIKTKVFLLEKLEDENVANTILFIIDHISFSKEKAMGKQKFNEELENFLTSSEIMIRNIVSDADKLDALGKRGFLRCQQYTKENNHHLTENQILTEVKKHADEKLFKLKDNYIRTNTAKNMAIKKEKKLREILDREFKSMKEHTNKNLAIEIEKERKIEIIDQKYRKII